MCAVRSSNSRVHVGTPLIRRGETANLVGWFCLREALPWFLCLCVTFFVELENFPPCREVTLEVKIFLPKSDFSSQKKSNIFLLKTLFFATKTCFSISLELDFLLRRPRRLRFPPGAPAAPQISSCGACGASNFPPWGRLRRPQISSLIA